MNPPTPLLAVAALLLVASCSVETGDAAYYDADGAGIYVREAPPPPRGEIISGTPPGPDHVWVGGYWARQAAGWTWVPGRWGVRPRPGLVWVPGTWERRPNGYVWIPGRWR